jgi:CubicO group peptidase (beta-lactamase class C family)
MHHLIIRLAACIAASWPLWPLSAEEIVRGELGEKLDAHMTAQAAGGFSGVLVVARGGEVVISKGYGDADLENKLPYTSATVFDIGSITKQFTAAAIVHLESAGKLRVEDTIGKYFADVPADKRTITLHHLLTHSAGLRDNFGGDYEVMSRDDIVHQALASKLLTPPGQSYRYSNAGYSLLAAVVEIVSGAGYEAYLREHFFGPLNMAQTGYRLPDWTKSSIARGVRKTGEAWGSPLDKRWADDGPYWNLRGNGGILSTVGDMYRWHLALESDKVLSAVAKAKVFTGYVPEGLGARSHYGYGWSIAETARKTKLVTHNGGNEVFYAVVRRYVDEDTVVIMASNDVRHSAEKQERAVLLIVFPAK